MGRRNVWWTAALTAVVMPFGVVEAARADTVRVQSTFDTIDSNLLDGLIRPGYAQAQPGDTLSYIGNGTGAALVKARNGEADVVVTHAPSLEAQFVADGFSIDGRAIFYSDYVIIGPSSDPAGVLGGAAHDAVTAYEKIAAAGEAGRATFLTRNDNSGTHVQEQLIWGLTSGVTKYPDARGAGRFAPSTSTSAATRPTWYGVGSPGQGDNVRDTSSCPPARFPNGGCYTMTDRGTFNYLVNSGVVTNLTVVGDKNAPSARGGENLLVNPFSAYLVNPDKFADGAKPNVEAGRRFLDYLTSASFQEALLSFPSAVSPAFFPDAAVKVDATVPATAQVGQTVPLSVALTDRLPGGAAVAGQPLQLQGSTDGGRTFADVGAATSGADGRATFAPAISTTTLYRVSLPRFGKFTASTSTLGLVTATPAPKATVPTPAPTPKPIDRTAPAVSKIGLTAKRLTFRITEAGTVRVTIASKTTRKVGGKRRTTYRTKKRLTVKAKKAGSVTKTFSALAPGTYRIQLRTTDVAGNHRSKTSVLVVKRTKPVAKKG